MGQIHIISRSEVPFQGREEAGTLLAEEVAKYCDEDTVVLGIPRGGVVIAQEIARKLKADLDIVLARKLGAPENPEFALGAISEEGKVFIAHPELAEKYASKEYLKKESERQRSEIVRRIALYRKVRPKISLTGRTVIVTDDGLATGATMQAGLWAARREHPKRLIAAVPIGPEDTISRIAGEADLIIVLRVPQFFSAVGQFYQNFDQTSDDEITEILKRSGRNEFRAKKEHGR